MELNRAKRIAIIIQRRGRKVSTRLRGNNRTKAQSRRACVRRWISLARLDDFVPRRTEFGSSAELPSLQRGQTEKPRSLECTTRRGNANARKTCGRHPRPFVKQNTRTPLRIKSIDRAATARSIASAFRRPAWRLAFAVDTRRPPSQRAAQRISISMLHQAQAPRVTAKEKFEMEIEGHREIHLQLCRLPAEVLDLIETWRTFAALVRHLKGVGKVLRPIGGYLFRGSRKRDDATRRQPLSPPIVPLSRAPAKRVAEESARPDRRQFRLCIHAERQENKKGKTSRGRALGFGHRQAESGQRDKRGAVSPTGSPASRRLYHHRPFTAHDVDGVPWECARTAIGETKPSRELQTETDMRGRR
ncbi:hypothetical protein MRX96_032215 [Rhipicephalus microplus]